MFYNFTIDNNLLIKLFTMKTWIHDMIREHDSINYFFQHQKELEFEYESYCNHCDGEPLSYDIWLHTDITFRDEDLPF